MKRKFKIPVVPTTVNKCIRMPENIVEEIEKAIEGKNSTFTAFVIEACKHALTDIKEGED
jgi:hypothetical protein